MLAETLELVLATNDPDQPGTASDKPLQTAMPRDSAASLCSPPLSAIREAIGYDVEWGPELRFTPEPQRVGNRLILSEDTKISSLPCRNVINDDSEKASELVVIPDDITGSVTVDCLGQAFKYNFESGSLVSIFSEYGPKTTT